tara:strand:- start:236 stop:1201 length:966 start_codon:yes stop_codon:yes gene_type:complete
MSSIVTKFKRTYLKEYYHIDILKEMELTKSGFYANEINTCRSYYSEGNITKYKEHKSELPAVAFCGKFENGHSLKNLVSYNSLMILDIDDLDPLSTLKLKQELSQDDFVMALWLSPSGVGLKGLIKVLGDQNTHKALFKSISDYILTTYNLILDKSGSDISRLCYVSYDPDLYLNIDSKVYEDEEAIKSPKDSKLNKKIPKKDNSEILKLSDSITYKEGLNRPLDRKTITTIIKYLKKRGKSITSTYEDWVKVALAISNSFTFDIGHKLFLELCRLDGSLHDEVKSLNLITKMYNTNKPNSSNYITFSTLVFLAQKSGFKR